jgi:HEAT repeat protein
VTCLPAIRACLSDADALVQAHAAWAMWTITGESSEAIRCLSSMLECNQEEAIVFACYVLGSMGPQAQSATPKLTSLQDDDSTAIRIHASEAMLKICGGGAQAIEVLKATLSSHKADERCLAAVALGSATGHDRPAATSALIAALYDADAGVRCSAALALGGFGADAKSAISALEVAASATDFETKDAAGTALACIRK